MKLGAHVSTAGGIDKAFDRAQEIGAEAIQIFATSPRAWKFREAPEAQVEAFRERSEETGISPAFIHASYLINVGGSPDLVLKSVDSLVSHMNAAGRIGAAGVIFHGGSHKGVGFDGVLEQAATALQSKEKWRWTPSFRSSSRFSWASSSSSVCPFHGVP